MTVRIRPDRSRPDELTRYTHSNEQAKAALSTFGAVMKLSRLPAVCVGHHGCHASHDTRKNLAQSSSAALAVSSARPMVMNPWIMSG